MKGPPHAKAIWQKRAKRIEIKKKAIGTLGRVQDRAGEPMVRSFVYTLRPTGIH